MLSLKKFPLNFSLMHRNASQTIVWGKHNETSHSNNLRMRSNGNIFGRSRSLPSIRKDFSRLHYYISKANDFQANREQMDHKLQAENQSNSMKCPVNLKGVVQTNELQNLNNKQKLFRHSHRSSSNKSVTENESSKSFELNAYDKRSKQNHLSSTLGEEFANKLTSITKKESLNKFDGKTEFVVLPFSKRRIQMICKKIKHMKHLPPVDPMLKLNQKKSQFATGFNATERSDSVITNVDEELTKQHLLWRQLEAMTGVYGMKFGKLILKNTLFPIVTCTDREKQAEESRFEWHRGDGKIVCDSTKVLWNHKGPGLESDDDCSKPDLNSGTQQRPVSPDFELGSLSPDYCNAQLGKTLADDSSQLSDDLDAAKYSIEEYDEAQFLKTNFCHPLTDNRFNQFRLKKLLEKEGTLLNANRISQADPQLVGLMNEEGQSVSDHA